MSQTVTVVFDGAVVRPEQPLDLQADTRYIVTIGSVDEVGESPDAWDVLDSLSGTIEAPHDWAMEHEHYLYGTPKRGENIVQ